jgi:hypothetical protein
LSEPVERASKPSLFLSEKYSRIFQWWRERQGRPVFLS